MTCLSSRSGWSYRTRVTNGQPGSSRPSSTFHVGEGVARNGTGYLCVHFCTQLLFTAFGLAVVNQITFNGYFLHGGLLLWVYSWVHERSPRWIGWSAIACVYCFFLTWRDGMLLACFVLDEKYPHKKIQMACMLQIIRNNRLIDLSIFVPP